MRQEGMKACSLSEHVKDLSNIASCLPCPPVLIGHSFGGLVAQRYAKCIPAYPLEIILPVSEIDAAYLK